MFLHLLRSSPHTRALPQISLHSYSCTVYINGGRVNHMVAFCRDKRFGLVYINKRVEKVKYSLYWPRSTLGDPVG
jgi:hypothetical protein